MSTQENRSISAVSEALTKNLDTENMFLSHSFETMPKCIELQPHDC